MPGGPGGPGGPAGAWITRPGAPPRRHLGIIVLLALGAAVVLVSGKLSWADVLIFSLMIPSIILHEIAHGWVAYAFGDDTAKRAGRLSLNPLVHVDPLGTVILPAILIATSGVFFGWAKPVPVNLANLRSPRNQGVLVSLAGPATNVALAALSVVVFHLTTSVYSGSWWTTVLFYFGFLNISLAAFNMLPIPPLDGSVLIERLLPRSWWPGYLRIRPLTLPILAGFVVLNLVTGGKLLDPLYNGLFNWWVSVLR
jgi:Zn-dependent protease